MAQEIVLEASAREEKGRRAVKKLRANGLLPAVIYGTGIDPRELSVQRHDFIRVLHSHGAHPLVTLKVGSDEYLALVKEVQINAVRHEAVHIDFLRVQADVAVHTDVPVHLVGSAEGVKLGGILEALIHSVSIEALPRAIPDAIELDVSRLQIGDVARVRDLIAPSGVTILTDEDETVATVSAPRVAEEAAIAAADEEAAAEAAGEGEAPAAAEGEPAESEEES